MCDVCGEFLDLLLLYEEKATKESEEQPPLKKEELETVFMYMQSWSQRQCMCCFRDPKNFERFSLLTQSVIILGVHHLKELRDRYLHSSPSKLHKKGFNNDSTSLTDGLSVMQDANAGGDNKKSAHFNANNTASDSTESEKVGQRIASEDNKTTEVSDICSISKDKIKEIDEKHKQLEETDKPKTDDEIEDEVWTLQDLEKLLHLLSKVFLVNFPLYAAYKHSIQAKLEDLSQHEVSYLSTFCDLHDPEIPIYLLRNVCFFCKSGGLQAMTACFEQSPETLSVTLAHAIIAIVGNLKLWLNFQATMQLFVPLRSKVLRYMCSLADKDLRMPSIKSMADYMWSAVKDPLDSPVTFDKDGMDLAFKYFTSSTLTMRLAGISQINSHINLFNELVNNESIIEVENVGQHLASWLIDNQIISHIFGPNLHVEVIKQSHVILSFLAMECKVTNEHIDIIWQAAQLKHCSKQVHDLLPPLIKNLDGGPVLHLYNLLCKLEPKDHTEQSLYLASALIKFIWTSGGTYGQMPGVVPFVGLPKSALLGLNARTRVAELSSSENSVSMEGSNSEEEPPDSSSSHKVPSESSDGPSPLKQARKHKHHAEESSDDSVKVEDLEDEEDDDEEDELLKETDGNKNTLVHKSVKKQTVNIKALSRKLMERCQPAKIEINSDNESDVEDNVDKIRKRRRSKLFKKSRPKLQECLESCASLCEVQQLREAHLDECSDEEDCETASEDEHQVSRHLPPKVMLKTIKPDQQVPAGHKKPTNFVQPIRGHSRESSPDSAQGGVMNELANLVQRSPHEIHDCRPFLRSFQAHGELIDEMSGEDGSYSSRMSTKSEKNMADFDGEDSGCEDELAHLAAQAQAHLSPHSIPQHLGFQARFPPNKLPIRMILPETTRIRSQFKIENVCKPGNTLLWDLLQDDKIVQLGDGVAIEAEKDLCNLLCFNTERSIRMKFIEGCLENLANNWSVVISLRLLPKLFASFQQFRGMDTHQITTWAEKELHMMTHFFNNLQVYTKDGSHSNLHSHQMEIQVRLQFLTSVFSPLGSQEAFRLSLDQVDILWSCLATDPRCCDELFSWLLSQAKNKDAHALGMETLKHLYLRKLPTLEPEIMSMTGLALFQQLCNLARLATVHLDSQKEMDVVGMDHLWRIALKASNTEVSMAAIQYLNSYYIGRQLDHESEFVSQCMAHLALATTDLVTAEDSSLLCIQRALLLLKTHLETFRRRYAYHLRRWALEGQGVGSHVQLIGERGCVPLRLVVQPAGLADKGTLELLTSDYVADLRAEVAKWWEALQAGVKMESTPVLGSLLAEGPLRMITQGQELTTEFDEKSLEEMGFKDLQIIFISMGVSRQQKKRDSLDVPSVLPPPPRESLPTLLLLQPKYFEQLFGLMHTLSSMKTSMKGHQIPHTKAQVLSRRVWDILTLLPTSPTLLHGFQQLDQSLSQLLDPASSQKFMYSLYIVESLGRQSTMRRSKKQEEEPSPDENKGDPSWNLRFVQCGGLRHLFDIFMSGVLQRSGGGDGSEWQQDCLALLLKLLCQLGVASDEMDSLCDTGDGVLQIKKARKLRKASSDRQTVPKLNEAMLQMMNVDSVMPRLTSILHESSLPRDPNHYKTGFWGRAQVVHYSMALLVSWVHSSEKVRQMLFSVPHFSSWLQRLVLEDPEPAVRREVCTALYRLCLDGTREESGTENFNITAHLLGQLLEYLSIAEGMRPQKPEILQHPTEDGKEPYGPACRDYFWLLCRLVNSLQDDFIKESIEDPGESIVDLDTLAIKLSESILSREYLETRHNTVEDDGLIGVLNLMSNVMKHNPPFKTSKRGQEFLLLLFDFLFALPNPRKRHVPKCKSQMSRSSAYDLLVELVKGAPENYQQIHDKLLAQQKPGPHSPYPWDYWPHDDGRSDCGYVGLTNLGATCYMASCMQHLYMMPQARAAILRAKCDADSKHELTLQELQRMFAYLLESERKAYNPRSFCKVYTMDHQPLNTGEQKDMAEFFIDLVSKLEEMTPELKKLVKTLFGGVISNNVVSLDCEHVSRTLEEFYTVRCQVADMRNLYDSLDEVTVKDTLEGDNMYTCSQCGKKVRAEKRACFKKLPHILCFNTMRYTFNMVTMLKEKVNTHFSFPLRLDMSGYVEKHLMPQRYQEEKRKSQLRKSDHSNEEKEEGEISGDSKLDESGPYECSDSEDFNECYEYDLIGVTVHTGTADGGHYYSFIRDRTTSNRDKWFLFNDAEVKPFDPNQIASECFGGEMTSKTYDSVTDKFMDFSFEKTNSAYMLFYEWCSRDGEQRGSKDEMLEPDTPKSVVSYPTIELSKELEDWIWQDNMQFLNDKNIFEHTYFTFMWQICGCIPQTLLSYQPDITAMAAQLSTSFFIETFIHAKEKPTMVQWVELLTKQFNASQAACEWFLDHMAHDDWWPMQILIKCPNQIVRQMFQRLCIHVIQRLRQNHAMLYSKPDSDDEGEETDTDRIGGHSCITRFVKMLLSLMEHGAKAHLKHLTEYFSFLNEFSRMGEEETHFLISVNAIASMINFYMGQKSQDMMEIVSEEEEEEEVIPIPTDKYKPASLEKMITLIASLLEKSRGQDHVLRISTVDMTAIAGAKGFPFLYLQIKDSINMNQTRNLIFALCRWNDRVALHIIAMIFQAINKHADMCQPFFKILTLLTEPPSSPSGLPCFSQLILQRIWEVAEFCPQPSLDWLAGQVPRNKMAHTWVLQTMDTWVEHFLIGHNIQRVRAAAGYLLVSLVPSSHFKQSYRTTRNLNMPHKDLMMPADAQLYLHQIYTTLLRLLKPARHYTEIQNHGTTKLTAYFALMTYCCISRTEKLMFGSYFLDLWQLFHPRLSEPTAPVHHNKQSLLLFWHHVLIDCPENVQLILQNPHCVKNIPYNYILADHEDQDVVLFNRTMLPAYYGILRMVCQQSRPFAKTLSTHQNMTWAYKNITPHPTQYPGAVDEIFKMIQLFITRFPDSNEEELLEVANFRRHLLQTYLQVLDGKSCWATLVMALRALVENDDDRLFVIYNGGLHMAFEAFHTLHAMYHEATACHVSGDMLELLSIILDMVKTLRVFRDAKDAHGMLIGSKEWPEVLRKIATMLNTYNPPDIRKICIDVLRETLLLIPIEVIQTLVPMLWHCHSAFQEAHNSIPMGPYFPRRGHKLPPLGFKQTTRPVRPMVQMTVPHNQLEASKGVDEEYDQALIDFYSPYHDLVDMMCRLAINHDCMSETLVNLSAMVGFEGVPLHFVYFPKLWLDIYHAQHVDKKFISILCSCNSLADYIESVLLDEKMSLNIPIIYNFLCLYFPKVSTNALTEATCNQLESMVATLADMISMVNRKSSAWKLNGDLRTLCVIYSAEGNAPPSKELLATLNQFFCKVKSTQKASEELDSSSCETPVKRRKLSSEEEEEGSKSVAASPSCSKEIEKDLPLANEDAAESIPQQTPPKASCDWLQALEKTIIDLKTIIESKG